MKFPDTSLMVCGTPLRHSACYVLLISEILAVTSRHLSKVEAVQHVHLTNIPVWYRLLGDI